jgi:hypothetical protein
MITKITTMVKMVMPVHFKIFLNSFMLVYWWFDISKTPGRKDKSFCTFTNIFLKY